MRNYIFDNYGLRFNYEVLQNTFDAFCAGKYNPPIITLAEFVDQITYESVKNGASGLFPLMNKKEIRELKAAGLINMTNVGNVAYVGLYFPDPNFREKILQQLIDLMEVLREK